MHQGEQVALQTFANNELLYRRYLSLHFPNNQLAPQHFKFPNPSFNRSLFSRPQDVLHVDCCGGTPLVPSAGWGVLECNVGDIPNPVQSADGRLFNFLPQHVPLTTCYAHSEIWCSCPTQANAEPSKSAKEMFRIRMARAFRVRIEATA